MEQKIRVMISLNLQFLYKRTEILRIILISLLSIHNLRVSHHALVRMYCKSISVILWRSIFDSITCSLYHIETDLHVWKEAKKLPL
jgi:hypothetical protein